MNTVNKNINERIFEQIIKLAPGLCDLNAKDSMKSESLKGNFMTGRYWNCLYLQILQRTNDEMSIWLYPRCFDCSDRFLLSGYDDFYMGIKIDFHSYQAETIVLNDGDGVFNEGNDKEEWQRLMDHYLLDLLRDLVEKGHRLKLVHQK